MMTEPNSAVRVAVINRDHGRCCLCGRPCDELWRCQEREDAASFSLICDLCRASIFGKTAPPARFVFHTYSTTKLRYRLARLGGFVIAALAVGSFVMLTVCVGLLLYGIQTGPVNAVEGALLIPLLLLVVGYAIKWWISPMKTRQWIVAQPGMIFEERVPR